MNKKILELLLILYFSVAPAIFIGAITSIWFPEAGIIIAGAIFGFLGFDALIGWCSRLFK